MNKTMKTIIVVTCIALIAAGAFTLYNTLKK